MAVDPMFDARSAGPPGMLAANADRERAIDVLKAGFAEGRLTKAEYEVRAARVFSARTYGELGPLIADLPAGPLSVPVQYAGPVYAPPPPMNSTAVGALTCGLAVFLTMGLTGIPAIVLGHRARREVRATGQRGDGMALAGMILGWVGVAFTAAFIVGLLAASAGPHTGRPVYTNPIVVKPAMPQVPVKPVPQGGDNPGGVVKGIVPNNG